MKIVLCLLAALAVAGQDYIVFSNASFPILNRFEQALTPAEKKEIPLGAPFLIVDSTATLGDQITPAMRLSCFDRPYFLLKTVEQDYRIIKGCTGLNDTLVVAPGKSLALTGSVVVPAGTKVIRILKHQGDFCLLISGPEPRIGWCPASSATVLIRGEITAAARDTALSADLVQKIHERIESANKAYQRYFAYFDSLTGEQKSVPEWRPKTESKGLRWSFSGRASLFETSTQCLVRDIEGWLIGSAFEAVASEGGIAVLPKGARP